MNNELNRAKWSYYFVAFAYSICALTSFGLSAAFLILFATNGTLDFFSYDLSQKIYAVIMILLTASATTFLFYLYQETNFNVWYKVTAIFVIAGLFSGGSEIGTQMQRHDEILMNRSKDSAEYQEAVKGIGQAVNASVSNGASPALLKATDNKAKATAEIQACSRHSSQARRDKCVRYESKQYHRAEAQIKAIKDSEAEALTSNSQIAKNMASLAKDLSHNEKYSLGIVKFIMSKGFELMAATLLIAFIMIGAFEMAFHGLGGIFRRKKDAYFAMLRKAAKSLQNTDEPALLNDPEKPRADHQNYDDIEQDKSAFDDFKERWWIPTKANGGVKAELYDDTGSDTADDTGTAKGKTQPHEDKTQGYDGTDEFGFNGKGKGSKGCTSTGKTEKTQEKIEQLYPAFCQAVLNRKMGDSFGINKRKKWLLNAMREHNLKHPESKVTYPSKKRQDLLIEWVDRMGKEGQLKRATKAKKNDPDWELK